jgi:hypothetical protein
LIRRALGFVLLASALKMLGVGNAMTLVALAGIVVVSGPVWMLLRRSHGFPALPSRELETLSV